MTEFVDWCAFFGAWLLFAGPVYQAQLELDAEGRELGEFRDDLHAIELPSSPSRWWWLIPPIGWVRRRLHAREVRAQLRESLSEEQAARMMHFKETATGWMLVAGGACLIGIAETWNLREAYAWPQLVFWLLAAVMIVATFVFCANRVQIRNEFLGLERRVRGRERRRRHDP